MKYDPIKNRLSEILRNTPFLKIIFFKLLGIIFLREWYIRRLLKKELPKIKPDRILDAGCGFGQYSYQMSKIIPTVSIDAVDLNPEHIEAFGNFVRKKDLPISVTLQDLTKYQLPKGYDFILCVDVMEHIEADRSVLINYFESLKAGGWLVISTPSDQGGSDHHHDHDDDDHESYGFVDEHARDGYSVSDMHEKLQSVGFENILISFTYGMAGNISWKLSVKYPILILNKSMFFMLLLPFYYALTGLPILFLHQLDTMIQWKKGTGLLVRAQKPIK